MTVRDKQYVTRNKHLSKFISHRINNKVIIICFNCQCISHRINNKVIIILYGYQCQKLITIGRIKGQKPTSTNHFSEKLYFSKGNMPYHISFYCWCILYVIWVWKSSQPSNIFQSELIFFIICLHKKCNKEANKRYTEKRTHAN